MRHAWLALAALAAVGCDNEFQYSGFQMTDFFPLTGDVVGWTFGNTDETVDYLLVRTLDPEPTTPEDGLNIWTWTVEAQCVEDVETCAVEGFQHSLMLSSDNRRGVMIWGYERPDTGLVEFDKPLRLADVRMPRDATVTTTDVDGHDFTVTFEDTEDCGQTLAVDWNCAKLVVTSEPAGHWLTGSWWATAGYNIVAFEREGDPGKWRVIRNPQLAASE